MGFGGDDERDPDIHIGLSRVVVDGNVWTPTDETLAFIRRMDDPITAKPEPGTEVTFLIPEHVVVQEKGRDPWL